MFDWKEYLALAEEMLGTGQPAAATSEARLRCAVSRAYYAAFGRASGYLRELHGLDDLPEKADIHKEVVRRFKGDNDKGWRVIGKDLDELREYRNDADYHADVGGWASTADLSLRKAARSVAALARLPGAPPSWF